MSNNEQKVTSNEQKVTSNELKVTSNEQKVTSNEQNITSNEQNVTSNEQQAKSFTSFMVTCFIIKEHVAIMYTYCNYVQCVKSVLILSFCGPNVGK